MNITLVRQDESAGEVNIALGEVTIGRGPLLGCTDRRVSREHARMKVSEEGHVILEAIHTNPLFYIKGEDTPVELTKSDFVVISDGDEFSLVPDSYRFRVVIPSQVQSNHNGHVKDNDSTTEAQSSDHSYKRHLPSWMTNMAKRCESDSDVKASRPQKRKDDVVDESAVNKKQNVASENSNASGQDGSLGDHGSPDLDVPGSKMEAETMKLHEMSDDEEGDNVRYQGVKTEVGESSEHDANTASQTCDPSTRGTNPGAGNVQKKRCMYGAQCYRKSAHHRIEFSHPGDPDYDDTDLPECPYGTACYRKNKQHRLDFRHSTKPRQAKRPQYKERNSDDDYDYDDPFINDASSDDYRPTDSGSDISDEMSSGEEESDAKRMMKEAKKFARRKK